MYVVRVLNKFYDTCAVSISVKEKKLISVSIITIVSMMWYNNNTEKNKCKTILITKNNMRNARNTHSNTHFSTHSIWLVEIHMGPTKPCGSHIRLVDPMWILTNQRECVEMCVASISQII